MGRKLSVLLAGLITVGLVSVGCSTTTSGKPSGGSNVIKIATQSPLSGEIAAMGDSIKMGAQLAVNDRKKSLKAWVSISIIPSDCQLEADPETRGSQCGVARIGPKCVSCCWTFEFRGNGT